MKKILLSCFNDGVNGNMPVALDWAVTLIKLFPKEYKIIILLHGECIKYCLKKNNIYLKLLKKMHKNGIKIRVCNYCLKKDGYDIDDKLNFIKPVKFSVDYVVKCQMKKIYVIYD